MMTRLPEANKRRAYLGLGSNMGDKQANLKEAITRLDAHERLAVIAHSRLFRTAPWGNEDQDWFVNACIAIETNLSPHHLLDLCLSIERQMGRERLQKWGARLIDIDVLAYECVEISTQSLTLPHPFLLQRAFVLMPLHDIAPDLVISGIPIREALLKTDCTDILPQDKIVS